MPQYKFADEGSPLAAFVGAFHSLAKARTVATFAILFKEPSWAAFIQDLTMLFEEGTTMGCRTAWIRRVLVPALQAQWELQRDDGNEVSRAQAALKALQPLRNADDKLLAVCTQWLTERWLAPPQEPAP